MADPADLPILSFPTRTKLEAWLEKNHASSPGFWLEIAKAGAGAKSVTYEEAVDAAISFGWIDGQKRARDETSWLQRFTPRRARSPWSKRNVERAQRLEREGRLRPAGAAQVDAAKADGRWERAYASPRGATVPDDLAEALAKRKRARDFFEALDGRNRYAILHRIETAKKPETRARRIAQFVAMLDERKKLH